jgi:hypothetical protein
MAETKRKRCKHCGKLFQRINGHEKRCPMNPERVPTESNLNLALRDSIDLESKPSKTHAIAYLEARRSFYLLQIQSINSVLSTLNQEES